MQLHQRKNYSERLRIRRAVSALTSKVSKLTQILKTLPLLAKAMSNGFWVRNFRRPASS
jgi:hypothetical protein